MIRRLLPLLAVALCAASCGPAPEPVESRLIILGFDGMDPGLAQRWMDDGSLPHFRQLAETGTFGPLATSNPPQSPVAWSGFATGTGPGEHGIYDFLRRDPETHNPAFSISEATPPEHVLSLFGMELPLDSGTLVNRRQGEAFWTSVENAGGRATVLRVPVTFPPDPIHRMMAGMGVPDLLGTQGTYTIYATRPTTTSDTSGARSVRMRPNREGLIETKLEGPPDPLKPDAPPLSTPMVLQPAGAPGNNKVHVQLGDADIELAPGEWSDWIGVEFDYFGPASVPGTVRLFLLSGYPRVELYVSPIQIDPRDPVVPLSSPPEYAEQFAEQFGLYHTIGMPEETWSLNEGHLTDAAWLDMVRTTLAEREAMFHDALDRHDSNVVVGVFVQTDRVSHMFYRGIDAQHPLHAETGPEGREAIHWIYREADRVLGETLGRMGPNDRLIVLSDHGFAPFRRALHLNRWLHDNGYLALREGQAESGVGFAAVDWSRTQAYALGLNSLFINRAGREAHGSVAPDRVADIKRRLMSELPGLLDPATGESVVAEVFDGDVLYSGNANGDAPDLVVGYQPGFRASWQTTLGAVPAALVDDNDRKWSGDHCVTPDAVPGVLFTSFQPEQPMATIPDVARYARDYWNR
jgi:predicted AlkP superfamily phosphohydrolase/phosphomutase